MRRITLGGDGLAMARAQNALTTRGYVNQSQAALLLGVVPNTLAAYRTSGKIDHIMITGLPYYTRQHLLDFQESQRIAQTKKPGSPTTSDLPGTPNT